MATHNFVVNIEVVGDEIEMWVNPELGEVLQRARRGHPGRKEKIRKEKKDRHNSNHKHPDILGPHSPFILVDKSGDSDVVVFRSSKPFVIDVEIDDGFEKKDDPPRSPFGWAFPQTSAPAGLGNHEVTGTYSKSGDDSSKHMFYKCTVWSEDLKMDPDFICDR